MSISDPYAKRRCRLPAVAALCVVAALALVVPAKADTVQVLLDQATVIKMPPGASTLVVGNPLIADVAVQAGGALVITGKAYGITNMVALDRKGTVLMRADIQVQTPTKDLLVVYRGTEQETYSCTPNCEPRIMLGDVPRHFDSTMMQTTNRTNAAQGVAAPTNNAPPR